MSAARCAAAALLVAIASGCASSALDEASYRFYAEGPEAALQTIDSGRFRDADLVLAALEKAVALQEVGRYEDSAALLERCAEELAAAERDPGRVVTGALVNDEAGGYRAEGFERVMVHSLALADVLALQDLDRALRHAEAILALVDQVGCDACTWPFERDLAATTCEALGDRERATTALAEAVAESPGEPFLAAELGRLSRPPRAAADPTAHEALLGAASGPQPLPAGERLARLLAAADNDGQPAPEQRVLHVLLLLGRGPVKVGGGVAVPWSSAVTWPEYVPRLPPGVAWARLDTGDGPSHASAPLTDVGTLAQTSLKARVAGLVAREGVKAVAQEAISYQLGDEVGWEAELVGRLLFALTDRPDLRHWSTLPASCQVLRVPLPAATTSATLVYLAPDGSEVDREQLDLPPEWQRGPLFVTRRMP